MLLAANAEFGALCYYQDMGEFFRYNIVRSLIFVLILPGFIFDVVVVAAQSAVRKFEINEDVKGIKDMYEAAQKEGLSSPNDFLLNDNLLIKYNPLIMASLQTTMMFISQDFSALLQSKGFLDWLSQQKADLTNIHDSIEFKINKIFLNDINSLFVSRKLYPPIGLVDGEMVYGKQSQGDLTEEDRNLVILESLLESISDYLTDLRALLKNIRRGRPTTMTNK